VVGAHWDNHFPVHAALSELANELLDLRFLVLDFWDISTVRDAIRDEFGESGGHADAADVSLMLSLDSSLVREDLLVSEFPPVSYQVGRELTRSLLTSSGVIGSDQTKASAEAGARIFDLAVEGYISAIEVLSK
jgi:creatinine amidohydrolase